MINSTQQRAPFSWLSNLCLINCAKKKVWILNNIAYFVSLNKCAYALTQLRQPYFNKHMFITSQKYPLLRRQKVLKWNFLIPVYTGAYILELRIVSFFRKQLKIWIKREIVIYSKSRYLIIIYAIKDFIYNQHLKIVLLIVN